MPRHAPLSGAAPHSPRAKSPHFFDNNNIFCDVLYIFTAAGAAASIGTPATAVINRPCPSRKRPSQRIITKIDNINICIYTYVCI